ncbi:FMRFamide receptor-like [Daphnia pulicaria]|uniref:FMRFamide receptor-like n=1 Tax=Daphnia pulicaria TaxID=35523 RepID=UPI001EEAE3E2|nr:FMRFamide receptor-like [Daphnia pulicaria]
MAQELLMNATTTTWWLDQNDTTYFDDGNQSVAASTADPAFVHFRDESRFWVQRVLLPIVATIGVFGNGVTILVLTRRGMRSSTNAYLTALAIADLVYLLCVFWLSLRHYPHVREDLALSNFYAYTWPYSLWLTDATTNTSVWLIVTFTVERYIVVSHPIRSRMLCTESRARKVIVGVYLICFTATLSTPFEWTVLEVTDPETNVTKAEITPSNLGNDETYQTIYYWFTSISFVLLPLTLLIVFNSFLIHSVRQSQKLRQIMTQRQTIVRSDREERAASNEIRITITLIAVVIMFLVCQLPTAATLIYNIFHDPSPQSNEEAVLRALGNIFNCLVSVNAACNFLLYCALSDKYRRTFMRTFCRCVYRPGSPFFTQVDNDNGHHGNYTHSRQASVCINQRDRYLSTRPAQRPSATRNTLNGSYLAIPDGNGTIARQRTAAADPSELCRKSSVQSSSHGGTRSPSLQSNISSCGAHGPSTTLVTTNALLVSKATSAESSTRPRWPSKWWALPWPQSSAAKPKIPTNNKPSNILIQVTSDTAEEINRDPQQTAEQHPRQQVSDEEVAFV